MMEDFETYFDQIDGVDNSRQQVEEPFVNQLPATEFTSERARRLIAEEQALLAKLRAGSDEG